MTHHSFTPVHLACTCICMYVHADLSDAFDETNSFGVTPLVPSLLGGLLHDVFQRVSVDPVPIEICYGLLSEAKDTNTFSLYVCVHMKPDGPRLRPSAPIVLQLCKCALKPMNVFLFVSVCSTIDANCMPCLLNRPKPKAGQITIR